MRCLSATSSADGRRGPVVEARAAQTQQVRLRAQRNVDALTLDERHALLPLRGSRPDVPFEPGHLGAQAANLLIQGRESCFVVGGERRGAILLA